MPAAPKGGHASPSDSAPKRKPVGVLRRPAEFEAVLRSGVRVSTRNFVARALGNAAEEPRLGMIAGRKAASRAVDRNRAKRLIREIFRSAAPAFLRLDVTIQLRSDLRALDNEAVRAELQSLLDSLGRRCRSHGADRAAAPTPTANTAAPDPQAPGAAPHRQQ